MVDLSLQLLGDFEVRTASGIVVVFPTRKTKALFAYLAISGGKPQPRQKLASLLWGNHGDERARANLRQTLSYLRRSLGPAAGEYLVSDNDQVSLDMAAIELDVTAFERAAADATTASLEEADGWYRGDLLEGLDLEEEEFDDWLRVERNRLRDLALQSLHKLLCLHMQAGALDRALEVGHRLLAIDPFREDVHRALMRIHLGCGQRVLAAKQYAVCRELFERELGIEPDTETHALYEEIRDARPTQRPQPSAVLGAAGDAAPPPHKVLARRRIGLWAMAAVVALAVAVPVTWILRGWGPPLPPPTPASEDVPVSHRGPTIAVLPFANLSSGRDHALLAEVISESIITELSRFRDLSVIARHSSFQYRGRASDVRAIGEELGARYILEGSVQHMDGQLRVTAQLIDAQHGPHVWAESYDGALGDLFQIQTELTRQIAGAIGSLRGAVKRTELTRVAQMPAERLKAYDHLLRATPYIERFNREDADLAKWHLNQAIALDPTFAKAYAKLAITYWLDYAVGYMERDEAFDAVKRYAKAAIEVDPSEPWAYWALAYYRLHGQAQHQEALIAFEKALELNPNDADVLSEYGWALAWSGRPVEGVARMQEAIRLNPLHPEWYLNNLSVGYLVLHEHDRVIATLGAMAFLSSAEHFYLAASHARLDQPDAARVHYRAALAKNPGLTLARWLETRPFARPEDREYFAESLRLASHHD